MHDMQNGEEVPTEDRADESIVGETRGIKERQARRAPEGQKAARLVRGARREMTTNQSHVGKTEGDAWCSGRRPVNVSPR